MALLDRDKAPRRGGVLRRLLGVAGGILVSLTLLQLPAAAGATAVNPSAVIAVSSEMPNQVLALSDRMIFAGALLILFAILAAVAARMWRDLLGNSGRP